MSVWYWTAVFCILLKLDSVFLRPPYGIGQVIIFLPCGFYLLSIFYFPFFFPRLISAVADWMSTILPRMLRPYCEFKMHDWNVLHAARWKYRTPKKSPKIRHLRTIAQLSRAISSQIRHLSTIGKKLLNSNISPDYLTICWTSPNSGWDWFISFRAPQLISTGFACWQRYCTTSGRQPNFAALNRGRRQ